MANPELQVRIGAVITDLERNLAKAQQSLQKFSNKSKLLGKQFTSTGKTMSLALSAPLAILGGLAIKTAANFETLGVSLNTTFKGNEKAAKAAFAQIIKFASKTPFQVEQVASAFIKLKNMGLDPSEKALRSYGDTASAMGKSLDQMVEAVADAATGEFERLKEFGIKARSEGDNVSFTFRGITKTVRKEAAAIEGYLMDLGETEFAGGMEAQSKTFSGRLSTLKDNVALLSNEFGKILIKMINPFIDKIGKLAKKFQELSPASKKVIVVVGLLVAALGPLLVGLGLLMTTVIPGLVTVFGFLKVVTLATAGAFKTLTTAMIANPIGLIVAAVAALTYGFVTLLQKMTPLVSKIRTFFNFIKSGGNSAKFAVLQMESLAIAFKEQDEATKAASDAAAQFKKDQEAAAKAAAKLTAELLKQSNVSGGAKLKPKASGVKSEQIGISDTSGGITAGDQVLASLQATQQPISDAQANLLLNLKQFNDEANEIIQSGIVNTFAGIGQAIGGALVNGGNVLKSAGGALLAGIGQIATRLGEAAIGIGVAMLAIKLAFTNPFTAIAAGIALVALGAALGGIANKAVNGGGGGFSGGTGGSGSSTFRGSSVGTSSTGGGGGTFVFEIAGTKLIGVMKNTLDRNKALGGSNNLLFG